MDFAIQREAMVALLRERQAIAEPVAAAMLAVPRHVFVPGVAPEDAYRDEPIVTKRDDEGRPISSSSQPAIMAIMLGQLGVEPGHRVLEIGAGTGYNAALLARLAGPGGRVVSVDIDEDVAGQARRHLAAAGPLRAEVVCADGGLGWPDLAPYDRLIATVGVWDLAPAWLAQLGAGGRLVVPLDLRGVQVSVAMERDGDHWVSRSVAPCGFMRMRGPYAGTEVTIMLRRDPDLVLGLPWPREVGDVAAVLDTAPTDVAIGAEPASPFLAGMGVSLWLALHEPRWCALAGKSAATGYAATAGIVEGDSIAVLAMEGPLAARGHGPDGGRLAEELAAHVRAWDEAGRPEATALRIEAHPSPATGSGGRSFDEAELEGAVVIRKRHTTLVVALR
ncbi:protein-L-isoaspartate(D-aspartate) O-methyltransferase [Nonomuraea solani]|uniref:Protein-L-isoaspartate O-methyltransferase n=1 Tax=Nonomuraea solani TaxID=1144553 RepID=A0A1H6EK86_9ACTN|nr:methyltransferase, FxLD system [Nonomuraea solani]SEG97164.1 protein-L-isoaspartate(D-aspartate) O-methyltransferase [Nonomuraea solani]